jgi:hypothetical protein
MYALDFSISFDLGRMGPFTLVSTVPTLMRVIDSP